MLSELSGTVLLMAGSCVNPMYSRDVLRDFLQEGKRVSVTLLVLQAPIFALLAVFLFMVSRQWVEMEAGEIAVL